MDELLNKAAANLMDSTIAALEQPKRAGKNIIFYTTDQQVHEWWDSIPTGERSTTLVEIIKNHIAGANAELDLVQKLERMNFELKTILNGMKD